MNQEEEKETEKGFFASIFGGGGTTKENITDVTLSAQQTEDIQFLIKDFKQGINFVEISSGDLIYKIPVYVSKNRRTLYLITSYIFFE